MRPPFRGWGSVTWLRGSTTVFVIQDELTFNARVTLQDSTAMEYFAVNETVLSLRPFIQAASTDIIHVQDSASSVSIINRCKPHGLLERILAQLRCQLLSTLPSNIQFAARHVTREFIPDCDYLSKFRILHADNTPTDNFTEFRRLLQCRLQFSPEIIVLGAPPGSRGRMKVLVHAKDHPDDVPSFASMRDLYT
jgi:hypothetical protein